jgi:hypothetical protein
MNQHSSIKSGSLLERAAELYGFGAAFAAPAPAPVEEQSSDIVEPGAGTGNRGATAPSPEEAADLRPWFGRGSGRSRPQP